MDIIFIIIVILILILINRISNINKNTSYTLKNISTTNSLLKNILDEVKENTEIELKEDVVNLACDNNLNNQEVFKKGTNCKLIKILNKNNFINDEDICIIKVKSKEKGFINITTKYKNLIIK
ncbi:MAG: hypothetical protein ACRCTZ_21865 [Sarcina sp.]